MERPKAVIIDGYNLIKRVPALESRLGGPAGLEHARSYLLGRLRAYQAQRRRVIVVFDGPRAGRSDFGPVEVWYAPVADDTVSRLAEPGALVVSSDLAVRRNAIARGAEVLSSEDFWQALTTAAATGGVHARIDRDADEDDDSRGAKRPARGNPKRKSKSEKRREKARINLMRKV